jgi:hypothetical protein
MSVLVDIEFDRQYQVEKIPLDSKPRDPVFSTLSTEKKCAKNKRGSSVGIFIDVRSCCEIQVDDVTCYFFQVSRDISDYSHYEGGFVAISILHTFMHDLAVPVWYEAR